PSRSPPSFSLLHRRPPSSTLFPYTTLFRSLSPLTTLLNYGPIDPDGLVNVRILYDHRVMDGATVARALDRFEAILNGPVAAEVQDRKSTRLNSSHVAISYAVFCLKKKKHYK